MLFFVLRDRNKVSKEMQIFVLVLTGTSCSWSGSSVLKSVPLTLREENSHQEAVVGWERLAFVVCSLFSASLCSWLLMKDQKTMRLQDLEITNYALLPSH